MFSISGHCPHCGAPIYTPMIWQGIIPPPPTYSCNCVPKPNYPYTNSVADFPDLTTTHRDSKNK